MALFSPRAEYGHVGLLLEPSKTPSEAGSVSSLMYFKGIREISYGMTLVALQWQANESAVTTFSAILSIVRIGDGLVVWLNGGDELRCLFNPLGKQHQPMTRAVICCASPIRLLVSQDPAAVSIQTPYGLLLGRHHPQSITQVMRVLDHGSLALGLDLLGSRRKCSHSTRLILALGYDNDRLALDQLSAPSEIVVHLLVHLVLWYTLGRAVGRQSATSGGKSRSHEGGAREDEADSTTVYANARKGLGEAMDESEVGNEDSCKVLLEEDGCRVENVEGVAVGKLHA
ncbi:hypothetical protein HG531_000641 [Fusarium graminearum]|nr:hypothetical protein HG531_000641 [Fusarium graminearum]